MQKSNEKENNIFKLSIARASRNQFCKSIACEKVLNFFFDNLTIGIVGEVSRRSERVYEGSGESGRVQEGLKGSGGSGRVQE